MFRPAESVEDFKILTEDLRRQNACLKTENRLLKVSVRKLQDKVVKKDKELQQTILEPQRNKNLRKFLAENGASVLLQLKRQNEELERNISDKEAQIKRLQNTVNNIKLYNTSKRFNRSKDASPFGMESPDSGTDMLMYGDTTKVLNGADEESPREEFDDSIIKWAQNILAQNLEQMKCQHVSNDIRCKYESLSKEHLISIVENLKLNIRNVTDFCTQLSARISAMHKDKRPVAAQLPQEHVTLFIELEQMKEVIAQLQEDKKSKDRSIGHLVEEINQMKTMTHVDEIAADEMQGHLHFSGDNSSNCSQKLFTLSTHARKQHHKEQISKALKLLKDQRKHPEKYQKFVVAPKVETDDDDKDVHVP